MAWQLKVSVASPKVLSLFPTSFQVTHNRLPGSSFHLQGDHTAAFVYTAEHIYTNKKYREIFKN